MVEKLLDLIAKRYILTEKNIGENASVKASGMKFNMRAFSAEGLGHVSVMTAKGFFGLMRMDTLIVVPKEKDLPLYSYDRIYAMGNDTLIVELYNTFVENTEMNKLSDVKKGYSNIPDHALGEHWYDSIKLAESISKKGKKADSAMFDKLAEEHFAAYLDTDVPPSDPDAKKAKAAVYVEGLLKNGGPSTDAFKKALGEEKTAYLFRNILFGTN